MAARPQCFLFDNGSLRAASTLSLRRTAQSLAELGKFEVQAVSLLHSSGVPEAALGGIKAQLLEPALVEWLGEHPRGEVILLPLFFGPSAALTDYMPERLRSLHGKFPDADIRLAKWLVRPEDADTRIASALADAARHVVSEQELDCPGVVLVDHGSPHFAVTSVRNHLVAQVRSILGNEISMIDGVSMERRPGPEYAFNDPLLASALGSAPFSRGDVIILLQFLSPGRHAGPEGDIAHICGEAERGARGQLSTYLTEPIGNDARVVEVLLQRFSEAK